jgi:hypothetical protein
MHFSSSLRLSSLWAAVLLVTGSGASPVNQNTPHRRQNAAPIAVTGLAGQSIQRRLELRELQQQNPDMWNIYLLGMTRMQQADQSDFLSHFQLAGPYVDGLSLINHPFADRPVQAFMAFLKPIGMGCQAIPTREDQDTALMLQIFSYRGTDHILRFMRCEKLARLRLSTLTLCSK